jgi:hypothetical protein
MTFLPLKKVISIYCVFCREREESQGYFASIGSAIVE